MMLQTPKWALTPEVMNDMLDFIGRYRILMSGFNILRVAHIINGLGILGSH